MASEQDGMRRSLETEIMDTSLELKPDEITFDHVLGDGPLGTVYKGQVRQNTVAIKVLDSKLFSDPQNLEHFKREVEALSYIRHPNLSLFMGYTLEPPKIMVVNELLKYDLETFLNDKEIQTPLVDRIRMAKDAALGMYWLHRNKLPHRELKPSNILVDSKLRVKVCDYGLAKVRQINAQNQSLKISNGQLIDSLPYWLAPELLSTLKSNTNNQSQQTNQSQQSTSIPSQQSTQPFPTRISYEKCDIYSFGIILWQLLTRREPFSDPLTNDSPPFADLDAFIQAVVHEKKRPLIPNDALQSLQELIMDCWDPNPNRRPPFPSIVKRLDHVIVDCAIRDPIANKFWKDFFLNSGGDGAVRWKDFCNTFAQFLGLTVPGSLSILDLISINHHKVKDTNIPLDIRCLHAIMVQPQDLTSGSSTSEEIVTMDNFGRMMDWFGPIRADAKALILSRIRGVLKQPWFHGDLATTETETRLVTRDVGTFLVRFSNSSPGMFVISKVVSPVKVNHLRVNRVKDEQGNHKFSISNQTFDTLEELVSKMSADLGLLYPCANWPFAGLFTEQVPVGGYVENEKP